MICFHNNSVTDIEVLANRTDYVIWYARFVRHLKFRQLIRRTEAPIH